MGAGLTFVHVEVEYELRRADEVAEVARAVGDAIAQHVDAFTPTLIDGGTAALKDRQGLRGTRALVTA